MWKFGSHLFKLVIMPTVTWFFFVQAQSFIYIYIYFFFSNTILSLSEIFLFPYYALRIQQATDRGCNWSHSWSVKENIWQKQTNKQKKNTEKYLSLHKHFHSAFTQYLILKEDGKKRLGILIKFLMEFALQSVRNFQWKIFGDGNGVKSKLCVKLCLYFPCDPTSACRMSLFKKNKSFHLQILPPQYSVKLSGYDLILPFFSQSKYRYSEPSEGTVLLQVSK